MNNKTNRIIFGALVAMAVFFAINSIGNSVFAKHHTHNNTDDMVQSAESNDDNSKIMATINDSTPNNSNNSSDDCKVSKKDCAILDDAISDIQDIVKNFNNAYPGMK